MDKDGFHHHKESSWQGLQTLCYQKEPSHQSISQDCGIKENQEGQPPYLGERDKDQSESIELKK